MDESSFQVYILKSTKHGRFYVGMSADAEKRLHFHNLGLNTSTRNGMPWTQVWVSELMSKPDALLLEKKIKKRGAARFLADMRR